MVLYDIEGRCVMKLKTTANEKKPAKLTANEKKSAKLMEAAREAAFAAAEAMDRRDLDEWNRLQDHAADLRKQAKALVKKSVK